jgi:hypothetical protein
MTGAPNQPPPPTISVPKSKAEKANLRGAPIPSHDAASAPEGLSQVYDALVKKAEEALRWYETSQRAKKRGARVTRGAAIFLGALAAITPSIIAVLPEHLGDFAVVKLSPIATAIGVLAGTLILLDKLYGFSSSWMRFAVTYQEIQANLEVFKLEWRRRLFELSQGHEPMPEQVSALLDFLTAFLRSVNDSVRAETRDWVVEFKGVLADIDKTLESQRAAALPSQSGKGALRIELKAVDALDEGRWSLQLENRKEVVKEGQATAVLTSLDPGIYKLRISGLRKGKVVAAEHPVVVKAGEIAQLHVEELG